MRKRKAEFQAEFYRHNNLIMEEASSIVDNDKDKNLLWIVLPDSRRTKMPDINSIPLLKEWENYFSKLLTSHDSNRVVFQLDERVKNSSTDYKISEDMLRKAIKTLKAKTAEDNDGVFSNHLKLAPSSLLITPLAIINLFLTTGLVPSSFYIGIVTPIPKSRKKDLSSCSSWGPITRGSMIRKCLSYV